MIHRDRSTYNDFAFPPDERARVTEQLHRACERRPDLWPRTSEDRKREIERRIDDFEDRNMLALDGDMAMARAQRHLAALRAWPVR